MSGETVAWPGGEGAPVSRASARRIADALRVLADPARLRILSIASANAPRPTTVTELVAALECSQSTVSHHLKQLTEAGLLRVEYSGTWSLYRADADAYARILRELAPR